MYITSIPFYNSLSGRLLAALAIVALLAVGGLGLADYFNKRAALEMQVKAQLVSIADLKKEQIISWLEERRADVRMLAVNKLNQDHLTQILSPQVSPTRKAEFTDFLTDNLIGLQQSRVGYTDISFVDAQGTVIVSTEPEQVGQPATHKIAFEETLKAPDGTYIQDIHLSPDSGTPKMAFGHIMHAIELETGQELSEIVGVAIITVDMNETIYPLIQAWPGMGQTGETLLVRAEGDSTLFLNNLRFDDDAALTLSIPTNAADAKPAHYGSRGQEGIIQTTDYRSMPVLAAYRHIPGINWGFVAKEDLEEAFAPVSAMARQIGGIAVAVLLVTGLVSLLFSRSLTRPLAELVKGTQAVAAGNLNANINIHSHDEIGTLADSFRTMMGALDQRQRQLEQANQAIKRSNEATRRSAEQLKITSELLHILNATPDISETFPEVVARLRAIMKFETISLALLDDSRQKMTIVAMDQLRVVPTNGLTLSLQDTAAATDLLAGRPHLAPYLATEIEHPIERMLYEAGYRSRLCLPLSAEGKSIGSLNLAWSETHGYDSTRLSLLEQLANAIALAVERSRLFEKAHRRSKELTALHELSLLVNSSLEPSEVLKVSTERTVGLLEAASAGVYLLEEGQLQLGAVHSPHLDIEPEEQLALARFLWNDFDTCGHTAQSISLDDLQANRLEISLDPFKQHGVQGVNLLQLSHNRECQGMLMIICPRPSVTQQESQLAQTVAQIISPALAHAQRYSLTHRQLQETNQRLTLVNQISRRLSAILDMDQLLTEVVPLVQGGLGYSHVGIGLVDNDEIVFQTITNHSEMLPDIKLKVEEPNIASWVIKNNQAQLVTDVKQAAHYRLHPDLNINSVLAVPIRLARQVLGVLVVASDQVAAFNEEDQELLQAIADQLALALQNAESYGKLRQMAIKALQESEERLRNIYEAANDAIFLIDPDTGHIIEANPRASQMLGYSQEELVGMPIQQIHPDQTGLVNQLWQQTLKDQPCQSDQLTCITKSCDQIPVETSFSPVQIRDRKYILAMVRDVTERKQLEAQLRQSQKMEAIGRLAGGIAHDFNNLLTVITGYSELLQNQMADEKMRKDAQQIIKAGERASALTRQLLAFSRRQMLQPKVVDINGIVADTEKLLRRLIGEDIELMTQLEPTLGRVKADPGQIEQVIMNLAINARDAMPRGGKLSIETANVKLSDKRARQYLGIEPGRYILLAVSDTGIGMDADTQAHIFEPFFTTKAQDKGTGLGLATVYGIVTQSEGAIKVYSEPNQGTTFKIYLPQIEDVATADMPADSPETTDQLPQGTETVLLVEDEAGVRGLAREILQRSGYSVLEAKSGSEALKISDQYKATIHLLLTDVVMPHMSGQELAEKLVLTHPETKVLYMSGYTDKAIVNHGILEPGTQFLQKPFTPELLARRLRAVLDNSPQKNKADVITKS